MSQAWKSNQSNSFPPEFSKHRWVPLRVLLISRNWHCMSWHFREILLWEEVGVSQPPSCVPGYITSHSFPLFIEQTLSIAITIITPFISFLFSRQLSILVSLLKLVASAFGHSSFIYALASYNFFSLTWVIMSYPLNTPEFPNQPLDQNDCTFLTCPVDRSSFGYLPLLSYAVVPLAGFAIITIGHGVAGIKYRTWPFGE